jgi:SAM-dependent methyltransferase
MTSSVLDNIKAFLSSEGIELEADKFLTVVSNVYHRLEAEHYDASHDEILLGASYWQAILASIKGLLPPRIRVLDIGCGTGFASEQVLDAYGSMVESVVCADLSLDMVKQCRARLEGRIGEGAWLAGSIRCLRKAPHFDLVITNAVLHHVVDLEEFLPTVGAFVKHGGFYVAGHEPGAAFYKSPLLTTWTNRYRKYKKISSIFSVGRWLRRLRLRAAPMDLDVETNKILREMGLINRPLPRGAVSRLVDVHVPPSAPSAPFWGERGLEPEELLRRYMGGFELESMTTYSHIKDTGVQRSILWRRLERALARRMPLEGADIIFAARRAP